MHCSNSRLGLDGKSRLPPALEHSLGGSTQCESQDCSADRDWHRQDQAAKKRKDAQPAEPPITANLLTETENGKRASGHEEADRDDRSQGDDPRADSSGRFRQRPLIIELAGLQRMLDSAEKMRSPSSDLVGRAMRLRGIHVTAQREDDGLHPRIAGNVERRIHRSFFVIARRDIGRSGAIHARGRRCSQRRSSTEIDSNRHWVSKSTSHRFKEMTVSLQIDFCRAATST